MEKITSETITRTIILALALINQILAIAGKDRIDILDETIYQVISLLFTVFSTLMAWWKNNSFTQAAIKADTFLKEGRKNE